MSPETSLQIACLDWWEIQPKYKRLQGMLYMVTNDGFKSWAEANIDKSRGLIAGIPDLQLAIPNTEFHGLYIELKSGKNGLNDSQKRMIPMLKAAGYRVEIIKDVLDFADLITEYLSTANLDPIREAYTEPKIKPKSKTKKCNGVSKRRYSQV